MTSLSICWVFPLQEKVGLEVPAVLAEAAAAPAEEFGVPEVPEELLSSEEYVLVPSTPELIAPASAVQTPAAPEQAMPFLLFYIPS